MNKINFCGRMDGLGNRFEQIIHLEAICTKYKTKCDYFWNNSNPRSHRRYKILVRSDRVNIIKRSILKIPKTNKQLLLAFPHFPDPENIMDLWKLPQKEYLIAAKKLKATFDIKFNTRPSVGVHIRGTDRIDGGFSSKKEFDLFFVETVSVLNEEKPECVFICADHKQYKQEFVSALDNNIILCDPVCSNDIPNYYRDFFALTLCEKIYLASKFSSFSVCASLVGNIPIVLSHDIEKKERWPVVKPV